MPRGPSWSSAPGWHAEILAAGVFTQTDAHDSREACGDGDGRPGAVQGQWPARKIPGEALVARGPQDLRNHAGNGLAKIFHFLTCFFSYPDEVKEFVAFAEVVGPQLIKQGSVSELMKQIRQTQVVKAAVEYQGEVWSGGGTVKLRPGGGNKGVAPPPKRSPCRT